MIPVTKPFLPPLEAYQTYIADIYARGWVTNNGPLVQSLEEKLMEKYELNPLLFLGNGTIAIQIAIQALKLKGEIITTPFSYVATTSSIIWEHCSPVFVDIDANSFNIDPNLIEQSITPQTEAILATHVFGNPCEVEAILAIADRHNLKVIYDAAHAFAVTYKGKSLFNYGDISTSSFHATKLFHTIEGGAVITPDEGLYEQMRLLRNFGHNGLEVFSAVGINGKNSEVHAAMGHCVLEHIKEILACRKSQYMIYQNLMQDLPVQLQQILDHTEYNHAYFPVVFDSEETTLSIIDTLAAKDIHPRRYFYPALNNMPYIEDHISMPIAESIAKRILCLPLYHELAATEIEMIVGEIKKVLKKEKAI